MVKKITLNEELSRMKELSGIINENEQSLVISGQEFGPIIKGISNSLKMTIHGQPVTIQVFNDMIAKNGNLPGGGVIATGDFNAVHSIYAASKDKNTLNSLMAELKKHYNVGNVGGTQNGPNKDGVLVYTINLSKNQQAAPVQPQAQKPAPTQPPAQAQPQQQAQPQAASVQK